ncbi:hypothetical protein Tco_0238136 [Tanacetum coccineum]
MMTSLSNRYERLKKIPDYLGLDLTLPLPQQDPSLPRRKRKVMELDPETYIVGLHYNRTLPKGVQFVKNLVIEKPEHGLFFIDAFGEEAFQRVHGTDSRMIDEHPDKDKILTKGVKSLNEQSFRKLPSRVQSESMKEEYRGGKDGCVGRGERSWLEALRRRWINGSGMQMWMHGHAAELTYLFKKVKNLVVDLKRKSKKVIVSESEGEEPEDQGRIIQDIDDDPLVSLVRESMKEKSTYFVTPIKASGEAQEEEEISPKTLEAAKTLSKVASQSVTQQKGSDCRGKRYMRRARSMAKKINTGLDAEDEINTGRVEINTGIEDVNTGSTKVDSGRREGKAQMVEEDIQATHKTKEQIRQEEAGLEEAIRLQAQMDEEVAKQIHLDKMLAKRVQEEQELSEQQLKRKVEVQKAVQFYTEED